MQGGLVEGADRYRDPDQDLPANFDARRDEHYAALGLPRDARVFVERVRAEMGRALEVFDCGMARNPCVRILKRGKGTISLTPLERQPEPAGLIALKTEIGRRWPMTSLLDMLKEADLRIGFTDAFRTVTDCQWRVHPPQIGRSNFGSPALSVLSFHFPKRRSLIVPENSPLEMAYALDRTPQPIILDFPETIQRYT